MDINATFLIGVVTFLWYRKGRLWNFYDSITNQSIEQIKNNSLDREAWEKIARENCDSLARDLINSLFRFEIEYLRYTIIDILPNLLWIPDSSSNSGKHTEYYDKEKYCIHILKNAFFEDFRFCGFGLFMASFRRHIQKRKEKEDTGYIETHFKK
jgi:hypothetical protein